MPEVQEPPKTEQTTQVTEGYSDPNAELNSLMGGVVTPEAQPEPVEEPKEPVSDEPETPKDVSEPSDPTQTPPDSEKPVEEPQKGPGRPAGTAKELRQALDNYKKENQALKGELEKVKKIKVEDPEKKTLLEKLQAIEKQKMEMESELKFANYTKTTEFKEKFVEPLREAFDSAYDLVKQLTIENGETGEVRIATEADFNKLIELPLSQAVKQAKEWFGDSAGLVISSRQKISDLQTGSRKAIEKHKAEASEREKLFHVEQQAQAEKAQSIWEETIREQSEKFPQFFGTVEGDDELNSQIEKDTKTVDMVFTGQARTLPLEAKIKLEATVRNKAIGFGKLAVENRRLNQKIAELEKKIASYKKSTPGGGVPQTEQVKDNSWKNDLLSELK